MPTVATNQPGYYGQGSVEVSSSAGPGEGSVRRLAITKDKFVHQPLEGIDTVLDVVSFAVRTHGDKNALGWRDIVRVIEEDKEVTKIIDGKEVVEKKKWKYFELSDYKYLSFNDVQTAISEVSRGLIKHGISKGDVFNIYAQTRHVYSCTANRPKRNDHLTPIARIGSSSPMAAQQLRLPLPRPMIPLATADLLIPSMSQTALGCSPTPSSFPRCSACCQKRRQLSSSFMMVNPSQRCSRTFAPSVIP